jgi:chemotaxis protein CheD
MNRTIRFNGTAGGTASGAPRAAVGGPAPAALSAFPAFAPGAHARETRRHVWTGQIEVGRGDTVLTALLGSCVGIGMIWHGRGVCALAHCLLPEGAGDDGTRAARYVSGAVPAMLAALGVPRDRFGEIEVVLAGGARMLRLPEGETAVGRRNIIAAHAQLAARGLMVSQEDVGGAQGRRLSIDCGRMDYAIERVGGAAGTAAAVASTARQVKRRILAPMS